MHNGMNVSERFGIREMNDRGYRLLEFAENYKLVIAITNIRIQTQKEQHGIHLID